MTSEQATDELADRAERELPEGDYAIVELFGHTMLVGRIGEVERVGTKMLAIEPIYRDELLPVVLHGGASIYRLTPCTIAMARARQPHHQWQLPPAIRCIVPDRLLPAPAADLREPWELDDEGGPF